MKNKALTLSLTLALSTSFAALAAESGAKDDFRSPSGCFNTGYAFDLKTLKLESAKKGKAYAMFLLLNKSGQNLNLFQMRQEESSRSMFLNHSITPKNWGVFATSEPATQFICTIPQKGNTFGEVVDCSQYLQICEFTYVKFGLNNRGNFWLLNSSSQNAAIHEIVHYGIIPMSIPKPPGNPKVAKRKKGSAS